MEAGPENARLKPMLTASLLGFSPATGSALGFSSFGCDWAVSRCSLRLANKGHDKMSQELKVCVLSLGTKLDARNLSVAAQALLTSDVTLSDVH